LLKNVVATWRDTRGAATFIDRTIQLPLKVKRSTNRALHHRVTSIFFFFRPPVSLVTALLSTHRAVTALSPPPATVATAPPHSPARWRPAVGIASGAPTGSPSTVPPGCPSPTSSSPTAPPTTRPPRSRLRRLGRRWPCSVAAAGRAGAACPTSSWSPRSTPTRRRRPSPPMR
jgi:hypothetical protein